MTDPTSSERAPDWQNRKCLTVRNIWSWAPDGAWHQDWPSVATWLRLRREQSHRRRDTIAWVLQRQTRQLIRSKLNRHSFLLPSQLRSQLPPAGLPSPRQPRSQQQKVLPHLSLLHNRRRKRAQRSPSPSSGVLMDQLRTEMRDMFQGPQGQLLRSKTQPQSPEAEQGRSTSREDEDANPIPWEDLQTEITAAPSLPTFRKNVLSPSSG
jgi:hypothetical protein